MVKLLPALRKRNHIIGALIRIIVDSHHYQQLPHAIHTSNLVCIDSSYEDSELVRMKT